MPCSPRGWAGGALLVYGLAGYPLVGYLAGHRYPAMPTFGLPCPTTILTIGMLLCLRRPVSRWPFVIPVCMITELPEKDKPAGPQMPSQDMH